MCVCVREREREERERGVERLRDGETKKEGKRVKRDWRERGRKRKEKPRKHIFICTWVTSFLILNTVYFILHMHVPLYRKRSRNIGKVSL